VAEPVVEAVLDELEVLGVLDELDELDELLLLLLPHAASASVQRTATGARRQLLNVCISLLLVRPDVPGNAPQNMGTLREDVQN
jgi:hypothetical protein